MGLDPPYQRHRSARLPLPRRGRCLGEVVPSARRLIQSLRDLGYDVAAAISDLIDNSISAGASNVWIDTHFDGEASWIRIGDDGDGMTPGQLREAMRFGTRRAYQEEELGKFGLGLKSASLSQCRRLTVASRWQGSMRLNIARWDLDHVDMTDRWEVLRPNAWECRLATDQLRNRAGTVVLWEGLDRVVRYRFPDGRRAQSDFDRLIQEIDGHLGMTFHRFIGGEANGRRRLKIHIDGRLVDSWDPFVRSESATTVLPQQLLRLTRSGRLHKVVVRPYVLPAEARFSSPSAHKKAGGPGHWARQQGLYFYRNDRLIQAGGWNRLRTQDEHTKLARIAVEVPTGADEAFELNVSKTQVRIPSEIRADVAAIVTSVASLAEEAYRRPRTADDTGIAETRLDAVAAMVRMILSAAEELINEEMGDSAEARDRLIRRFRQMESSFLEDLAKRLGLELSPA